MFATKHILYDLSEASKITGPGLGSRQSRGAKVSPIKLGCTVSRNRSFSASRLLSLVGENGAENPTLLEAMRSKYEERDEEEPGMLYDGTEAYKIYANVLPEHIQLIETRKPEKHFFFRAESFLTMLPIG